MPPPPPTTHTAPVVHSTSNAPERDVEETAEAIEARAKLQEAKNRLMIAQWQGQILTQAGSYRTSKHATKARAGSGPRPIGGRASSHLDRRTLQDLRADAQNLDRNNPLARAMLNRWADMIVGDGSSVRPLTDDTEFNKRAFEYFTDWANRLDGTGADPTGEMTLGEMEWSALRTSGVDGSVLLVKLASGGLQVIETERLRNPGGATGGMDTDRFIGGVERDPERGGVVVRYHVADYTPDGARLQVGQTRAIDAANAIFFRCPLRKRFNQVLGEPALAAVADRFEHLDGFDEATRVAAWIGACFAFAVETATPNSFGGLLPGRDIPLPGQTTTASGEERVIDIEPGKGFFLRPGEKITPLSPAQPTTQYERYIWTQVQLIGADLGLPIVLSLLDFSKVNMSSARSAVVIAAQGFLRAQEALRWHVLTPIYRWKIANAIRRGELEPPKTEPGPNASNWLRHEWTMMPMAVLDPLGEIQAEALKIEKGLGTRDESLRKLTGRTFGEWLAERAAEQAAEREAGITLLSMPGQKDVSGAQAGPAAGGVVGGEGKREEEEEEESSA